MGNKIIFIIYILKYKLSSVVQKSVQKMCIYLDSFGGEAAKNKSRCGTFDCSIHRTKVNKAFFVLQEIN